MESEKKYKLTIPCTPVAKARPRFGKHSVYTPANTKKFEDTVRYFASKEIKNPLKGAVRVSMKFYLPRPKRLMWKTKPMPAVLYDKRPDISNFIKSIEDSLNGIAYLDDGQIAIIHAEKWYHDGNGKPHIEIEIEEV